MSTPIDPVAQILLQYGLTGVVILIFYKLITNEMKEVKDSIDKLRDSIERLMDRLAKVA